MKPFPQAHHVKNILRAKGISFFLPPSSVNGGEQDILQGRILRNQMKGLENEPQFCIPQSREAFVREVSHRHAIQPVHP